MNEKEFEQAEHQLIKEVIQATAEGVENVLPTECSEFHSYVTILEKMGVDVTQEIEAALKDPGQNPTNVIAKAIGQALQTQTAADEFV